MCATAGTVDQRVLGSLVANANPATIGLNVTRAYTGEITIRILLSPVALRDLHFVRDGRTLHVVVTTMDQPPNPTMYDAKFMLESTRVANCIKFAHGGMRDPRVSPFTFAIILFKSANCE